MRFIKLFLIEIVRWIYWYPARFIIQRVPMGWSYRLAPVYAYIVSLFDSKKKERIYRGLSALYRGNLNKATFRRIVRRTFENSFESAIEVLWYPKFTKELSERVFVYEGLENIDRGLKAGKGVILLHGHFGNAHLIMPAIGNKGYRLNQLGSRNPPEEEPGVANKVLNIFRQRYYKIKLEYKERLPVNFIYADENPRNIFRCLRNNEILAYPIDGREGLKKVELDFLGRKAFFSSGGIKILADTEAAILPTFVIRQNDNRYKIIIEPRIAEPADGEGRGLFIIRKFLDRLEEYVKQYPCHYAKAFYHDEAFFQQ